MLEQPQHTFAMFSTLMLAGDTVVMVVVKPLISVSALLVSNGLQACMRLSWHALLPLQCDSELWLLLT